jgi:hypothetical protein
MSVLTVVEKRQFRLTGLRTQKRPVLRQPLYCLLHYGPRLIAIVYKTTGGSSETSMPFYSFEYIQTYLEI